MKAHNTIPRRDMLRIAGGTMLAAALGVDAQVSGAILISSFNQSQSEDENLVTAARQAVSAGVPLIIDRPVTFTRKWNPPAGVAIRGDGSAKSVLTWGGTGEAIEITNPVQIDGITIDGGVDATPTRTSKNIGCLIGIHGPTKGGSQYLSGVKIGSLRIRRTDMIALVMTNLSGMQADRMIFEDIYCNALLLSGIKDSVINAVVAHNIGDLLRSGSRRGSAVAIMTEVKPVSSFYDTTQTLPTENLTIQDINIKNTTDSAVYVHNALKTGVSQLTFGTVRIDTAGKDGFKTRLSPVGVKVDKLFVSRAALRGVGIESDNVTINQIEVSQVGFDAVGAILGQPAAFSGGDGAGQSISNQTVGVMVAGCRQVTLGDVKIANVCGNPVNSKDGTAVYLNNAQQVKIQGSVTNCDGIAARIAGCTDFEVDLNVTNPCLKGLQRQAFLLTPDNAGESRNGVIEGVVRQQVGGSADYVASIANACNIQTRLKFSRSEFPRGIRDNSTSC